MDFERTAIERRPGSLWGRMVRVTRAEGWQGIARRVRARARQLFRLEYHYMLAYPLERLDSAPAAKTPLQIEVLSPEDGETIRELVGMYGVPADEQGLLERLRQKEYCYLGRVDGRLVSYLWVLYDGDVREYGKTLYHMQPDEIYFHDAYTVPEQRGKNIMVALSVAIGRDMAARLGKKRIVKYVRRDNTASLNLSRKFAEDQIGWVGFIKVLGRRLPFYIPIQPRPLK